MAQSGLMVAIAFLNGFDIASAKFLVAQVNSAQQVVSDKVFGLLFDGFIQFSDGFVLLL